MSTKNVPNVTVDKYVIMPNHIHVVIFVVAVGARGGTVMHSRCIADENVVGPLGYDVQDETEIVLIIAPSEDKISIMKAITESCGVHSEANGIVMSLPIDTVMGL